MIRFEVGGVPQVQGNHRVNRSGYTYDTNRNLAPWREQIAWAAAAARCPLLLGPVRLEVVFWLPVPKSAPKRRRLEPIKRPDCSKMLRAVEDALTGVAYKDDSQIVMVTAAKRYAYPPDAVGATISVGEA